MGLSKRLRLSLHGWRRCQDFKSTTRIIRGVSEGELVSVEHSHKFDNYLLEGILWEARVENIWRIRIA